MDLAKKIKISSVLAILLLFLVTGCGINGSDSNKNDGANIEAEKPDYLTVEEKESSGIRSELLVLAVQRNQYGDVLVYEVVDDPDNPDTDGDYLFDWEETEKYNTDPNNPDTDDDGVGDWQEIEKGTNPLVFDQCVIADVDEDGLNDCREVDTYKTNPNNSDTDGDGMLDGYEVRFGYNPLIAENLRDVDSDHDGLSDYDEINIYKTNPHKNNTDGDEALDGKEIELGLNPLVQDVFFRKDSDGDGLFDNDEINTYHTNPKKADTDGDGFSDGDEVAAGYNPNGEGEL